VRSRSGRTSRRPAATRLDQPLRPRWDGRHPQLALVDGGVSGRGTGWIQFGTDGHPYGGRARLLWLIEAARRLRTSTCPERAKHRRTSKPPSGPLADPHIPDRGPDSCRPGEAGRLRREGLSSGTGCCRGRRIPWRIWGGDRVCTGDATTPLGKGPKVIAHVCNDLGRLGQGLRARDLHALARPEAAYRRWTGACEERLRPRRRAGHPGDRLLWVANMIGPSTVCAPAAGPYPCGTRPSTPRLYCAVRAAE